MRKLLVIALLAALLIPVFADDGTVLPAGVFRARVIPAFGWAAGGYDSNGNYVSFPNSAFAGYNGTLTAANLGFSLEYGLNDWVTLGLQWAPGITFASNIPLTALVQGSTGISSANQNGPSDLFFGVMLQIVGPKAPVVSDVVRFDLAPGINIPFASDLSTQTGSTQTIVSPDIPAFGFGGRAYLDYVFSPSFFLDLYSQFIDYPTSVDSKYYSPLITAGTSMGFGYTLRVELDPHYIAQLSDSITLTANCAFRYDGTPEQTQNGVAQSNTNTTLFTANPAVSVFFQKFVVPLELELDYGQPLYGINAVAAYSLDLQAKVYFKL